MKRYFFNACIILLFVVGCTTPRASKESVKGVDIQRDVIETKIKNLEQIHASTRTQMEGIDLQVETLKKRVEEIQNRVHLLIEIERSNVCINILPEDLSRSAEMSEAYERWLQAKGALPEGENSQELKILEQQFLQAVQRSVVTESTQLQTLSRELEKKEKTSSQLRSKLIALDRELNALDLLLEEDLVE